MVFNKETSSEPPLSPKAVRICVMKNVEDEEILQACQVFDVPVLVVENFHYHLSEDVLSVYVVDSFEEIESNGQNSLILGRTALLELAKKKENGSECIPFTSLTKPLFSHALSGQIICLANFRKEELKLLKSLINQMGGYVDNDISSKVTHLVTNLCSGERYNYAVTFDVCILSEDWIYDAWKKRNIVGFEATEKDFITKYKLKPFHKSRICFLEYPNEEEKRMIEALRENGGEPTDLLDQSCTHLVVNETKINTAPPLKSNKTFVVKTKWFWASIQHGGRLDEKDYVLRNAYNIIPQNLSCTSLRSFSQKRSRKRKRPKDSGQSVQKRRLSEAVDSLIQEKPKKTRYDIFSELLHTERNYVGILRTIMTLFKGSLEKLVDTEDQLLNATELKIIFSHLPPIYDVHSSMLVELEQLNSPWNDNTSIGKLIQKYLNDLAKAYPPFTNFFLNTRDMLIKCDKTKPRFHAFLKDCQLKPECGRQSLQELLISPVQRLFQIDLLLKEMLKYTSKSSVDYKFLEQAIITLQDVLVHINEAKRKIESQVALFEIFNKIDHCPAHLVSSQRHFISRCEVTELSDDLSGRGDGLVLFLFSDVMEVCKKRKAFNSLKSPKENTGSFSSKHDIIKLYKHVQLLSLNAISKIIDVKETEDCHNVFALRVKQQAEDSNEKTFSFTITDESIEKSSYLHALHTQIVNISKTDDDDYLINLEARQLDIDTSEVATGTLGRTLNKFTSKTRVRVGRALSFNSTPNRLKRAVSSMMSPFNNLNGLTPSSQLANLQLSSLPNISTTDGENLFEK